MFAMISVFSWQKSITFALLHFVRHQFAFLQSVYTHLEYATGGRGANIRMPEHVVATTNLYPSVEVADQDSALVRFFQKVTKVFGKFLVFARLFFIHGYGKMVSAKTYIFPFGIQIRKFFSGKVTSGINRLLHERNVFIDAMNIFGIVKVLVKEKAQKA